MYRVGQRAEAHVTKEIFFKGHITKIQGGCYYIEWDDLGTFQYLFQMIDEPNNNDHSIVILDGFSLPEELFTI